jgi:TonB family protein
MNHFFFAPQTIAAESWLFEYLLNALWQVPLIFAAAYAIARLARRIGTIGSIAPHAEHRLWVGAIFLELLLPACHLRVVELMQELWAMVQWSFGNSRGHGETRIILGPGTVNAGGLLHPSPRVLAAVSAAYACALLYFAARLCWGVWRTHLVARGAVPLTLTGVAPQTWSRLQSIHTSRSSTTRTATSTQISGPITIGIRHMLLLMPRGFVETVDGSDLEAVLAHEYAHMRRYDFGKNLFYSIVSLPIAFHPFLWLTRSRLAESREMICDALAAESIASREDYARSLLRLASTLAMRRHSATLHAIGIFDTNTFERRIMNLTQKPRELKGLRRHAVLAACTIALLVVCTSALALRVDITTTSTADSTKRINVKSDDLKIVSKVQPVYPVKAKEDKNTLDGNVELTVIIGTDGTVENIQVKKSLREDYDQSAIDAVRQWRYQPFLLNGDPVEVETTVTVVYSLAK